MTTEPPAPALADPLQPPDLAGEPPTTAHGPPQPAGKRRAALGFIFVTALIDIIAIGVIIPVLPKLVQSFTQGDAGKAAQVYGVFGAVFALMQFVSSPFQGALSDRFGRRPVLLVSIFGLGLDYILMALAPNLAWLFVGRIISGMTAASFSTANAYIADITPPEKRAAAFGLMGTAFGVGFILGPLLGGLLGQYDPRWPFWAAAALALANGLYGLFVLPESLPEDRRAPFVLRNANPLGSMRLYGAHRDLTMLAGVLFLFYLAHQVLQSSMVLYTTHRYGWTAVTVGLSLGITGLGSILVQSFVIKPFVKRWKERGALYCGLFCGALGMAWYGTAPTGWLYWGGAPVFALMGLVGPGINGLMSRRVSPTEQGRLQGANSGLMAGAGLIGPILFTEVFAWSIRQRPELPGLALYLSSAFILCALALAWRTPRAQAAPAAAAG